MHNQITAYAKAKYDTTPEHLWKSSPEYAVLRHRRNRKWYAVIMLVDRARLHINGEGEAWIINVKTTDDVIEQVPYAKGFLPGYHMNKKYWISILLDGSVPLEVVERYLDISYKLTS